MKAVYLEEGAVNAGDISLSPITDLIETTIYKNTTEEDKFEHIGDAEVVFTNKVIFDRDTFLKCPNLKYIGVCATGYNVIDLEAAREFGVAVTNVPAYSTESVAQLAWGLILEMACNISAHNQSVKEGAWVKSETFCYWIERVVELSGKTMGVVGFGNIGKRVCDIALAFGMKVLVYTAHPEKYANTKTGKALDDKYKDIEFVSLDDIWAKSDVISLHCPMTADTEKIICSKNISKMKDGVFIVNVSRGGLVDEQDLADALKQGKVAKAAVDVVSVEPMKEDNPLLHAPNTTITPHMAWASIESRKRLIQVVADNYKAFANGEQLNRID